MVWRCDRRRGGGWLRTGGPSCGWSWGRTWRRTGARPTPCPVLWPGPGSRCSPRRPATVSTTRGWRLGCSRPGYSTALHWSRNCNLYCRSRPWWWWGWSPAPASSAPSCLPSTAGSPTALCPVLRCDWLWRQVPGAGGGGRVRGPRHRGAQQHPGSLPRLQLSGYRLGYIHLLASQRVMGHIFRFYVMTATGQLLYLCVAKAFFFVALVVLLNSMVWFSC